MQGENDRARFEASVLRGWSSPYALFTGMLIFIYVGTETAISGWIATYALRLGESTNGFETLTPSVFWAGLLMEEPPRRDLDSRQRCGSHLARLTSGGPWSAHSPREQ